jgi:hypothetical protein
MAKDAGGHGSEGRGSASTPADANQHRILRDTVRNPAKGMFLGGPRAEQAELILKSKFGYTDKDIQSLRGVNNADAAKTLASGPKSASVDVHPAHDQLNAWGQTPKFAAQERARLRMDSKMQLNKPPSQRRSYP